MGATGAVTSMTGQQQPQLKDDPPAVTQHGVSVPVAGIKLDATLTLPERATSMVVFSQASAHSRFNPRSKYLNKILNNSRIATLLFDLLTGQEHLEDLQTYIFRFNVDFLAERLISVTKWLQRQPSTEDLPIGYFGSGTGAAAALVAAASLECQIGAVVSRSGRADLASESLAFLEAPTLFIVGENDYEALHLNREALAVLRCEKKLAVVPGAIHLFEEPGALQEVAWLAAEWFLLHLRKGGL